MDIVTLQDIEITDMDIDWVESLLVGMSFDDCRRNIIKNLESVDIQACPGSGKTTVLIAKLAILAHKWPSEHQGICVLSHTNVAREEIQNRLGMTEVGRKLLSYPHFIGTLHSFCDTYIGIPWIKSRGIQVNAIDTDFTTGKRWRKLQYGTRTYLEARGYDEKVCEAKCFPIKLDIGCRETTNTYQNLREVIDDSIRQGNFTYDEMLLFANRALDKSTFLPQSIQKRFPILFIDEAQDTSLKQWELIKKAFSDDKTLSIRQGFGDINQAIYSSYNYEEDKSEFPRPEFMRIGNSKRFSMKVASLADPVSPYISNITGDNTEFIRNDNLYSIFLFSKDNIENLIPAFANHVLNCFADEQLKKNAKAGCHIIGMVHKGETERVDQFPKTIRDYWKQYNPDLSGRTANPKHMIEYFRIGKMLYQQYNDTEYLIDWIMRGLRRYINMNSSLQIPSTTNAFRAFLNQFPLEEQMQVRIQIQKIAFVSISSVDCWSKVVLEIKKLCDKHFCITSVTDDIFSWVEPIEAATDSSTNTLTYTNKESLRSLDIHLGTIHSIKGQTHLATLVVETYWYKHNISSILKYLMGNRPKTINKKTINKRETTRLKCHYVALTRAKGLVCIALANDSVDQAMQKKLQERGWNIICV